MDLFLLLSLLALALYFAGFILLSSKKKEDIKIYVLGFGLSLIGFLLFAVFSALFTQRTFAQDKILYGYLAVSFLDIALLGLLISPLLGKWISWKYLKSVGYAIFFCSMVCVLAFSVLLALSILQHGTA